MIAWQRRPGLCRTSEGETEFCVDFLPVFVGGGAPGAVRLVTKVYPSLFLVGFALVPAYLIGYLFFFKNDSKNLYMCDHCNF